ncbi:MAG TPA: hypothetical protein ENJ32_00615 [Crenotrichaceae bacterium]|nr:hypothetical protein [Crenotrichaceae bacterium]
MQTDYIYWKRKALRTTRLIWLAILTVPILAIIICQFGHASLSSTATTLPLIGLRTIFYCVAILLFPLMRLFRNRRLIRSTDKQFDPQQLTQRFKNRVFVSLLMAEFILWLGLILCLLGDHIFSFYLLIGLSVLAMIIYRPQPSELNELHT